MEWESAAIVVAGLVAPFLVQVLRRMLEPGITLKDWRAQAVALIVSALLAIGVGAAAGALEWNGDLIAVGGVIFAIASVVYKVFQVEFDKGLPSKS